MHIEINLWAVLLATISAFILGGFWYSPMLFGKVWQREAGRSNEDCQSGHAPLIYGTTFLLALIAAMAFGIFIGPAPRLDYALISGLIIGVCWVTTSFGINYLFAGRSFKLFLIDSGYHIFKFALFGLVLGLWH